MTKRDTIRRTTTSVTRRGRSAIVKYPCPDCGEITICMGGARPFSGKKNPNPFYLRYRDCPACGRFSTTAEDIDSPETFQKWTRKLTAEQKLKKQNNKTVPNLWPSLKAQIIRSNKTFDELMAHLGINLDKPKNRKKEYVKNGK